ncbi:hypothetical protein SAMN04487831_10645 [Pseudobutyrivibrio sp. UC1225]|uniref:Hpt domain-containing protein n=1 Tax=Pseudobutyrivibrio sp. UC1225 TaxID=1798185 RepID=UPI0008EE9755|nr:Hpt domain-containing protein [Pseudobutyrivibrio sp. UC1225]SFO01772.1 hypothetical protein SAMN04487831_10645 [Pseudobutyrivibrio sp. UC1225]
MDVGLVDISVPQELIGLSEIAGISISDGLHYCGSLRDFEKFLDSFYEDIDFKSADIENSYKNGDIPYFTIKVHALKTSARIIGAKELGELAYELEAAGKSGNLAVIDENVYNLLNQYRSYKVILNRYVQEKQRRKAIKKPISKEELGEAFDALREIVPTCDIDAVEMILEELSLYQLPESNQHIVDEVNRLLHQYDWDGLETLLCIKAAV